MVAPAILIQQMDNEEGARCKLVTVQGKHISVKTLKRKEKKER